MNACKSEYVLRSDGLEHCAHCGSITPADVLKLLITNGVEFSGSDWKYGYPHKFYFKSLEHGNLKFYTIHFKESEADLIEMYNRLAENTLGVKFFLAENGDLKYNSPYGHQAYGTVWRSANV